MRFILLVAIIVAIPAVLAVASEPKTSNPTNPEIQSIIDMAFEMADVERSCAKQAFENLNDANERTLEKIETYSPDCIKVLSIKKSSDAKTDPKKEPLMEQVMAIMNSPEQKKKLGFDTEMLKNFVGEDTDLDQTVNLAKGMRPGFAEDMGMGFKAQLERKLAKKDDKPKGHGDVVKKCIESCIKLKSQQCVYVQKTKADKSCGEKKIKHDCRKSCTIHE